MKLRLKEEGCVLMIDDDFEVSIKITVHDTAGNFEGEYQSEILDDETVHAIMEQVAKAREVKDET